MVSTKSEKKKMLDMTTVDVNKFSFVRYYDQVQIHGEDANGNQFEMVLGLDAAALIRQATSNLIQTKLATGV